jgi:hypothetical protein
MYKSTRLHIPYDPYVCHYLFSRDFIAFEYFLGQQNFQELRSWLLIIKLIPVEKRHSFTNGYSILDLPIKGSSENLSTHLFIKLNITNTGEKVVA